jgi:hypothetical protein
MNTQPQHSNINHGKISLIATLLGIFFIITGTIFLFSPKILPSILPSNLIEQVFYYEWMALAILTVGLILNLLSFKLNNEKNLE